MLKKIALSLMILLMVCVVFAEEVKETGTRQYMGFHVSDLCATGLAYRNVGTPLGYSMIIGGTANGKSGSEYEAYFNTGFMGTYKLKDFERTSFFFFAGSSYHYKEDREEIDGMHLDSNDYKVNVDEKMYYGMGLGLDFVLNDWGLFSIHWPLTFRNDGYISMYVPMASFLIRFK
ncbi:MAG: hypothetical protein JXR56_06095 [Candidatus Cloacimonetes bacterium]|nr:hypothetical protein [Candidatus Cloacimonadota bacterium]